MWPRVTITLRFNFRVGDKPNIAFCSVTVGDVTYFSGPMNYRLINLLFGKLFKSSGRIIVFLRYALSTVLERNTIKYMKMSLTF
jgi:hypothetical protein